MSDIDIGILKQEILSLLVSAKDGLNEHELLNDYRMFNSNQDVPYRELGYSSLLSLLRTWPDICRFQNQSSGCVKILAVEEENTKHILSMVRGQRASKSKRRKRGGKSRGRGRDYDRNFSRENRGGKFAQQTFQNNRRMIQNPPYNNNNNNRFQSSSRARTKSYVGLTLIRRAICFCLYASESRIAIHLDSVSNNTIKFDRMFTLSFMMIVA